MHFNQSTVNQSAVPLKIHTSPTEQIFSKIPPPLTPLEIPIKFDTAFL